MPVSGVPMSARRTRGEDPGEQDFDASASTLLQVRSRPNFAVGERIHANVMGRRERPDAFDTPDLLP